MSSGGSQKRKAGPDSYTDNVWKRTKGTVNNKLERARPYGFFLSAIDSNPSTHTEDLTLSFPGIPHRYTPYLCYIWVPFYTLLAKIKIYKLSNFCVYLELLDKSLGQLVESLHINFVVELGWLFAQYFITDQR